MANLHQTAKFSCFGTGPQPAIAAAPAASAAAPAAAAAAPAVAVQRLAPGDSGNAQHSATASGVKTSRFAGKSF